MTRTVFKFASVALLAGMMAMPVSAFAGGRISFDLAPRNSRDAALFSTGLRAYSLFRGIKDGDIRQMGNGNAAGLAQAGRGNLGIVQQQGNGNRGTLRQNGNNGSGATFSFGW
jgi:hypothetical protein